MARTSVIRLGMAEARSKLPELADELARSPERIVEVTRRGKPALHIVAPPRVKKHAVAVHRILARVAALETERSPRLLTAAENVKETLYGKPR